MNLTRRILCIVRIKAMDVNSIHCILRLQHYRSIGPCLCNFLPYLNDDLTIIWFDVLKINNLVMENVLFYYLYILFHTKKNSVIKTLSLDFWGNRHKLVIHSIYCIDEKYSSKEKPLFYYFCMYVAVCNWMCGHIPILLNTTQKVDNVIKN